ncbi:hypothetical protein CB1_000632038 [Camelus ferus]|nr:hypothetical protein CB1_000632038 [Camelus ferus]
MRGVTEKTAFAFGLEKSVKWCQAEEGKSMRLSVYTCLSLVVVHRRQAAFSIRVDIVPVPKLGKGTACKRKEQEPNKDRNNSQKKSRLVFTDLQRRTLFAIFKENKRPSKEMQITISQQLGLELTTVSNFFMNARRRSLEKWQDDLSTGGSSSTSSTCTKA